MVISSFCTSCWQQLGAVSIRKTVLPGMAIPMLKIRRPNGRLIFNMEITIRIDKTVFILRRGPVSFILRRPSCNNWIIIRSSYHVSIWLSIMKLYNTAVLTSITQAGYMLSFVVTMYRICVCLPGMMKYQKLHSLSSSIISNFSTSRLVTDAMTRT